MRAVLVMLVVVLIGSTAMAQNSFKRRAQTAQKNQTKPKVDFSVEPSVAPSEELDVTEFQLKRKELKGKVIELEFDRVVDLKQSDNGYTARVTFESGRIVEGMTLLIPEEGLDLFQKMAEYEPRYSSRQTIYVEVLSGNIARALGERFSKNKPEGERYSW